MKRRNFNMCNCCRIETGLLAISAIGFSVGAIFVTGLVWKTAAISIAVTDTATVVYRLLRRE
jgi:hypothetical protein